MNNFNDTPDQVPASLLCHLWNSNSLELIINLITLTLLNNERWTWSSCELNPPYNEYLSVTIYLVLSWVFPQFRLYSVFLSFFFPSAAIDKWRVQFTTRRKSIFHYFQKNRVKVIKLIINSREFLFHKWHNNEAGTWSAVSLKLFILKVLLYEILNTF